jgi:hypothetical protein
MKLFCNDCSAYIDGEQRISEEVVSFSHRCGGRRAKLDSPSNQDAVEFGMGWWDGTKGDFQYYADTPTAAQGLHPRDASMIQEDIRFEQDPPPLKRKCRACQSTFNAGSDFNGHACDGTPRLMKCPTCGPRPWKTAPPLDSRDLVCPNCGRRDLEKL